MSPPSPAGRAGVLAKRQASENAELRYIDDDTFLIQRVLYELKICALTYFAYFTLGRMRDRNEEWEMGKWEMGMVYYLRSAGSRWRWRCSVCVFSLAVPDCMLRDTCLRGDILFYRREVGSEGGVAGGLGRMGWMGNEWGVRGRKLKARVAKHRC